MSGVRDAFSNILSTTIGNLVTVTLVLVSGDVHASRGASPSTSSSIPVFLPPARYVGRRPRGSSPASWPRIAIKAEMNNLMVPALQRRGRDSVGADAREQVA